MVFHGSIAQNIVICFGTYIDFHGIFLDFRKLDREEATTKSLLDTVSFSCEAASVTDSTTIS